jgi:uncharacterized protein
MASEENINAIAERPYTGTGHPLLRKGPLIELVCEGPHPSQITRTAKRIVAAVELAKGPNIAAVAARLVTMDICRTQQSAEASLTNLWQQLHPETVKLNNLYVHVTFGCQLRCTHCYANAGNDAVGRAGPPGQPRFDAGIDERRARQLRPTGEMSISALDKLIREAHEAGFRQVIITGGEPLTHRHRNEMLAMLATWRKRLACASSRKMNLVLRTNFAMPLSDDDLRLIAVAFDQVVASVDGTEQTHDARRGKGSYAATVRNLEDYRRINHRNTETTEQQRRNENDDWPQENAKNTEQNSENAASLRSLRSFAAIWVFN